ncbi:hypothetical protein D3C71_1049280 [compost metagenome]
MHDDAMGHFQERAGAGVGRNHGIHLRNQKTGIGGMPPLCRGGKEQLHLHAQHIAHQKTRQHFEVAAGMPDARATLRAVLPEPRQIAETHMRQMRRQAGADGGHLLSQPVLHRYQLDDGGGDAGEPALEVRRKHLHIFQTDVGQDGLPSLRLVWRFNTSKNNAPAWGALHVGAISPTVPRESRSPWRRRAR